MLARNDWIPRGFEEPKHNDGYARSEHWIKQITLAAGCALVAVAIAAAYTL